MKKRFFEECIVILLIILFVYAATSKLIDYQKFTVQLGQSVLLSRYSSVVAWLIPSIEILIAILLMVDRFRVYGLYSSFFLMSVFAFYILYILKFSPYVPCTCGGLLQSMTWEQHLVFNFSVVILSGIGVLINEQSKKIIPST